MSEVVYLENVKPVIRLATAGDLDDVRGLYGELGDPARVAAAILGKARWEEILEHPGTTVHCAEIGGKLVSMATLHLLPNMTHGGQRYGLVENVVTAQAHRAKGLGRKVMQHIIDHAFPRGTYKIMLMTGRHRGARGFYEKLGFDAEEKQGMILRKTAGWEPSGQI